jgi:hypothetical protein
MEPGLRLISHFYVLKLISRIDTDNVVFSNAPYKAWRINTPICMYVWLGAMYIHTLSHSWVCQAQRDQRRLRKNRIK